MECLPQKNDGLFSIQVISEETIVANKKEIGSANMLLAHLPSLVGAKELANAYKVVFPAGAMGKLMTLKNTGLVTTSIIGKEGKIVAQAGLSSLTNLASPLAVFTVLSMVTGQYFMAEINKSIKDLSENIEEVQRQVDTLEEAVVFSASIFLQEVQTNWKLILESEDFKLGIISNIIKNVNDLTASCYFFVNRLNAKISELDLYLDKDKIPKDKDNLKSELERNKVFLAQAYEVRSCLKMILFFLTSGITESNSNGIKEVLEKDANLLFIETANQLNERLHKVIKKIKAASTINLQEYGLQIGNTIIDIRNITNGRHGNAIRKNISETIDRIKAIDCEGQTFFVMGDKLYIEETV